MDSALFRRGYSFFMQNEAVSLLNQWGLIPLYRWLKREKMASKILLQHHDSLIVLCPPEEVWLVSKFFRDSVERERSYWGVKLSVPSGFELGSTWAGGEKWNQLPKRREMEEAAWDLVESS